VIAPIVVAAVIMGVVPNLFLRSIEPSVERLINQVHQGAPARARAKFGIWNSEFGIRNTQLRILNPESIPGPRSRAGDSDGIPNSEFRIPN
jgi:hypothetical protein